MNPVIVTTSWDDGHICDVRLAALLTKYGIRGTFYVSPECREFPPEERLSADQIRQISQDHEIGAHTMTHPCLDELDAADARREIIDSKARLEGITGTPVRSFCYPYGRYKHETKRMVLEAGFGSARSVQRFQTRSMDDFARATSVDTFDHRRDGLMSVLHLCGPRPWQFFEVRRWENLAKIMFEQARERGEVFHLWGHGRELEAQSMWGRLEEFLAWLSKRPDVTYVCNADVPAPSPRVLIATPYFKPHDGGVEEYTYQVARGLKEAKGWDVSVVTSGESGKVGLDSYAGIKTYRLPYQLRISNTPVSPWWGRKLKKIIKVERPDVIIAHAPVPGMLEAAARRANKIPLVVTYHQGTMEKGARWGDLLIRAYEHLVLPRVLRKANIVICSSGFVRSFITEAEAGAGEHKAVVIYPGVDMNKFAFRATKPTSHHLLHVGGLETGLEHKGLETSLRVAAALKAKYADVQLSVVGQGARRGYYEDLADELGISQSVEFRGLLDGTEMVKAYQDADVLILPSRKEAFGIVLIEAMACGTPVVAAAAEGVIEVVQDGEGGFLVNPDDIAGFVNRVSEIFDDPLLAQRFSEDGPRVLREREFNHEQQVNRTAEVLECVLRPMLGGGSASLRQSGTGAVNLQAGKTALG